MFWLGKLILQPCLTTLQIAIIPAIECGAGDAQLGYAAKIRELEIQSTKLLDRRIEADNKTVIAAYEERISKLEQEKLLLAEKADLSGQPVATFEQMFELAMRFPANLCNVLESGRFDLQRLVLKLTFSHRIAYDRNEGFRTPKLSLPFSMLGVNQSADCNMAEEVGFEPTEDLHLRWFSRPVHSTTLPLLRAVMLLA